MCVINSVFSPLFTASIASLDELEYKAAVVWFQMAEHHWPYVKMGGVIVTSPICFKNTYCEA